MNKKLVCLILAGAMLFAVAGCEDSKPVISDDTFFDEYYDEMIDSGVFDDWNDFDIPVVVDNDVATEIDTYTEDEFVEEFGPIELKYESMNEKVATVKDGVIAAKGIGQTNIIVKFKTMPSVFEIITVNVEKEIEKRQDYLLCL